MMGVLGGTGGGGRWWPETVGKAARKFAATEGVLCRLIVGGILGKFLRPLQTQLRPNMSYIL